MIAAAVRPRGPFSLRLSARLVGDATRTKADGPLTAALASGGVGDLSHLEQLAAQAAPNITGVIVGRALYERKFTVAEANAALT